MKSVLTHTFFQDLHVDADLNGLILGESLLNDAVAIVLVGSIENYSKRSLKMEHIDSNALIFTILSFFTIFIGKKHALKNMTSLL